MNEYGCKTRNKLSISNQHVNNNKKKIKQELNDPSDIIPEIQQGYNSGQNIWNKIGKSSKTGQDKKSLISTFACFLTAIAKV